MKITTKFLQNKNACREGIELVATYKDKEGVSVVKQLIKDGKLDWANWLIVRIMKYKQYVSYAVYAAEQVIGIYEKKYPNDKRPRQAIEAAKRCIENPTKKNKAAAAAAYAAYAAAAVAYADAAAAAAAADDAAVAYAAYAVYAAKEKMKLKILKYGIELLTNLKKK